eukprot:TRINITY_DN2525_c0_g1_i3.p1 TRINITY_DN2525_c0_g1~~TRINITY_DN2525_c0_g1_i3.p1  ORF type:complete len:175 (-),score=34.16 TRINITY_DN2525_c0_g1_i3:22-546(-)
MEESKESVFGEYKYLRSVWWFDVKGKFLNVKKGNYLALWRAKINQKFGGRELKYYSWENENEINIPTTFGERDHFKIESIGTVNVSSDNDVWIGFLDTGSTHKSGLCIDFFALIKMDTFNRQIYQFLDESLKKEILYLLWANKVQKHIPKPVMFIIFSHLICKHFENHKFTPLK